MRLDYDSLFIYLRSASDKYVDSNTALPQGEVMLFDGIKMVEGTDAKHFALQNVTELYQDATDGEMVFLVSEDIRTSGAYIFYSGSWYKFVDSSNKENAKIVLKGEATGEGTNEIHVFIADTGVAGGSYGNNTNIPTLLISDDGRITSASNHPVMVDASAVVSGLFADERISLSSIKQHQKGISIGEDQIENGAILARVMDHENIYGTWTFLGNPKVPYPQNDGDAASKAYVDNKIAALEARIATLEALLANK